jgi:hypothetical protein
VPHGLEKANNCFFQRLGREKWMKIAVLAMILADQGLQLKEHLEVGDY